MNKYQQQFKEIKMITTYNIYIASVSVSLICFFTSFHGRIKILIDLKDYSFKHGNI